MEKFDGYKAAAEIIVGPIATGTKHQSAADSIDRHDVKNDRKQKRGIFLKVFEKASAHFAILKDRLGEFLSKPIWKSRVDPEDQISLGKAIFGACAMTAALSSGMKFDDLRQCVQETSSLEIPGALCYIDSHVGQKKPNGIFGTIEVEHSQNVPEAAMIASVPSRTRDQLLVEGYGRAKKRSDDLVSESHSGSISLNKMIERSSLVIE